MAPERHGAGEVRFAAQPHYTSTALADAPDSPGQRSPASSPPPQAPGSLQPGRPMDDDLTNLTWLQDSNLLQSIRPSGVRVSGTVNGVIVPPTPRLGDGGSETGGDTTDCSSEEGVARDVASVAVAPAANTIQAPGEAYDPTVHVHSKPPYSFSSLIFMAVEDSPSRALPVKEIYSWILAHFPYFQNAPNGWKNSVRHNLSLNKSFLKVDKGQNVAKGSLWCIDPEYRPNLLLALRKTPPNPFHPIRIPEEIPTLPLTSPSAFCLTTCSPPHKASTAPPVSPSVENLPNPDLFPFLSKRLAASATKELEVDAAATMLSLKSAPRILAVPTNAAAGTQETMCTAIMSPTKERRHKRAHNRTRVLRCYPHLVPTVYVPVITVSPSEDHTYSSTSSPPHSDSPGSSIDEPFEFGHQRRPHLPGGGGGPTDDPSGGSGGADSGGDSGVTRSGGGGSSTGDDEMEELPFDDEDAPAATGECSSADDSLGGGADDDYDAEEQKKIVEGADALLNLAGIRTEQGGLVHHHHQHPHQGVCRTRDRRKASRHMARHDRLEHVVQR